MIRVPVPAKSFARQSLFCLKNQGFSVATLRTNETRATVQWLICKTGYAPVLI